MEIEQSPLHDDTSFIPADYNYFSVDLRTSENFPEFPIGLYIVPFDTNELTFTNILENLYKILNIDPLKYPIENIKLCLSVGNPVSKSSTIEDLRLKLCR